MDRVIPRRRITVDEYYRMAEEGLLSPDARVELIEGEIIDMPPIGTLHAWHVDCVARALFKALEGRASIRVQNPVRLSSDTEPQPDFAVVLGSNAYYKKNHPFPRDTLLVIEVSDTSLRDDAKFKVPLYARYNVPEVWIVDVQRGRLGVFRDLRASGVYAKICWVDRPTLLTIERLPDIDIDLSELFESN